MTKMEPAMRDYLAKLRDEAAIQVKSARTPDSGATANEIKYSSRDAYTPPQPKKKKSVERTRFPAEAGAEGKATASRRQRRRRACRRWTR